jgi:hypothetical protein
MSDPAGDSLGGFELRLLEELKLLVETPSVAVPTARRRWLPRSRFVLALVVAALVVGLTAASIGAWRIVREDPHKRALAAKLRNGGHIGPLVASSGGWSLYIHRRPHGPTDNEVSSQDESAVGAFFGKRPIELTGADDGSGNFDLLAGQVNAPGAASVALVFPGHQSLPVPLEGKYFIVSLSPSERHPEEVLALDAAGKVVARARP